MRPFLIALLAILPAPVLAQKTACTADHYRIVPVGIVPAAINNSGVIAGATSGHKAASWSEASGTKEVPLPPGFHAAEAIAINNKGEFAGLVTDQPSGKRRAFVYRQGRTWLLPGSSAKAWAVNDGGAVAGEATLPGKEVSGPVLWHGQAATSMGGCCGGIASAVNNQGEVAGQVYDEQGSYSAFRWNPKQGMQRIGPPGTYSAAVTINDQGHIVVQEFTHHEVFLYADGKLTPMALSPKSPSRPRGTNNCDGIVGSFGPFADVERAFVWDPARGFRDLNDLIPAGSGWKLEAATGINDHGEIVGWGDFKHQEDQGFLLIPQP